MWAGVGARVLAVCGDDGVVDAATAVADLPAATSTDPDVIAAWLTSPAAGRRLVVTTHVSAGLLGLGLRRAATAADILVVDEAHHSAGTPGKHTALVHDDAALPARRRLYLTATPRLGDGDDDAVLSMDDPAVFGPVLHRYPFAQAIADGWLDDYRIAIIAVTRTELLPILRALTATGHPSKPDDADGPLRTAMVATALARAAREFDLRRILVYHPRIATSRAFTDALPRILAALPATTRPDRPLTCHHIDGQHPTRVRRVVLSDLADPPHDGWVVVSNARCLGEGVDPAVDCVVFGHPKTSAVDIVQATGRALRRNLSGSGVATILVPVLVADERDAATQADLAGYHTVWEVVRALRAHDEVLAAELDRQRQYPSADRWTLPDKILVRVPDGYDVEQYLRHLTIKLVSATTSPWWEGYGAAVAFHTRNGHLNVHVDHTTDEGYPLGRWVHTQRSNRRRKLLAAARVDALDQLGIRWDPRATKWQIGLAYATAYRQREGHLRVPPDHVTDDGYPLGQWIRGHRKTHNRGRLAPDRATALEALGIEWSPYDAMWQRGITAATALHQRHGHLKVPDDHVEADGYRLGQFLVAQRMLHKRGTLAAERVAALEALGMVWHRGDHRFQIGLAHARRYHDAHGHLHVPHSYHTPDGYRLGAWINKQRQNARTGTMPADRAAALDTISPTWRG